MAEISEKELRWMYMRNALRSDAGLLVSEVRRLRAELEAARKDTQRLDYLEKELRMETDALAQGPIPKPTLFRGNRPITRKSIDAAMEAEHAP